MFWELQSLPYTPQLTDSLNEVPLLRNFQSNLATFNASCEPLKLPTFKAKLFAISIDDSDYYYAQPIDGVLFFLCL